MDRKNRIDPPEKYRTFTVSLPLDQAAEVIVRRIEESVSGELLDDYTLDTTAGTVRVLTFEKFFARVGNRLVLTAVLDNVAEGTRVHVVSGGGGESVWWKFDWYAADDFADEPWHALADYRIDG